MTWRNGCLSPGNPPCKDCSPPPPPPPPPNIKEPLPNMHRPSSHPSSIQDCVATSSLPPILKIPPQYSQTLLSPLQYSGLCSHLLSCSHKSPVPSWPRLAPSSSGTTRGLTVHLPLPLLQQPQPLHHPLCGAPYHHHGLKKVSWL